MEIGRALRQAAARWREEEDCPKEVIAAFNKLAVNERKSDLALFVRDTFLDAIPEPYDAARFIDWFEEAGANITSPLGIFIVGAERYEVKEPERVLEWLSENLEDGSYEVEDRGESSGLHRFALTLNDVDRDLFRLRWI